MRARLSDHLNNVSITQLVTQRHDPAIDLRPCTPVPNICMNGISKIDWSGSARQLDHFTLRRECVNILRIEIEFKPIDEFSRIGHVLLPFYQSLQPYEGIIVGSLSELLLFVFP